MIRTPASIAGQCSTVTRNLTLRAPTRPGVITVSKMRSRLQRSPQKSQQPQQDQNNSEPPRKVADPQRVCPVCHAEGDMELASSHEIVCRTCGASVDGRLMPELQEAFRLGPPMDGTHTTWTRIPTALTTTQHRAAIVSAIQQLPDRTDVTTESTTGQTSNINFTVAVRQPGSTTGYKRVSHFMERLSQLQGIEQVSFPDELVDALRVQMNRLRITPNVLAPHVVRLLLKKLRRPEYFENSNSLAHMLGGFKLPTLSEDLKDKLKNMFLIIQDPFERFSPAGRKNFLSYNFVLRKFLEILEQDHLLQFFPPLKSRDKNVEQEMIWQRMCDHLAWPYYSTS